MHRTFSYSGSPDSAAPSIESQAGGSAAHEAAIGKAIADYVAHQADGVDGTVQVSGSVSITVSKFPRVPQSNA